MTSIHRILVWVALATMAGSATASVPSHHATSGSAPQARRVVPFIEDDYSRALAQARASKEPIFIEAWAPW